MNVRDELKADIRATEERLTDRLEIVESAVRQSSADIRQNSADIAALRQDVGEIRKRI